MISPSRPRKGRRNLRCSSLLATLLVTAIGSAPSPVAARDRDSGPPKGFRWPGTEPVEPPQDPLFPILPGTLGPTVDFEEGERSGDAASMPGIAEPPVPQRPRPFITPSHKTWDGTAEARDIVLLDHGGKNAPTGDSAAWWALGVALIGIPVIAAATTAALFLTSRRLASPPLPITRGRHAGRE